MFAVDTNVAYHASNKTHSECDMMSDLGVIHRWLIRNSLRPNLDKTQFMIFSKPGQIVTTDESLLFNDIPIQAVSNARYLGVLLDQNLD